MKLPEIIGIAGTNGSGKDTLANLRHERQAARNVGLSDILRIEAGKRGLESSRENLRAISTEWASEMGAAALALMVLRNFEETRTEHETGLSVVSVRRPAEAKAIKEAGGTLLWVDAPIEVRYDRVANAQRNRVDDAVSFSDFCVAEETEMFPGLHIKDDSAVVNMGRVRDLSDRTIYNNHSSQQLYEDYLVQEFEL